MGLGVTETSCTTVRSVLLFSGVGCTSPFWQQAAAAKQVHDGKPSELSRGAVVCAQVLVHAPMSRGDEGCRVGAEV